MFSIEKYKNKLKTLKVNVIFIETKNDDVEILKCSLFRKVHSVFLFSYIYEFLKEYHRKNFNAMIFTNNVKSILPHKKLLWQSKI